MMYLLRGQSKIFARQIILQSSRILFAELVGSLTELKDCVKVLRGQNGGQRYSLYTQMSGDARPKYTCQVDSFSYSDAKTFYRKVEATDFYELLLISDYFYKSIQEERYNISRENTEFNFLFKANDLAGYITGVVENTEHVCNPSVTLLGLQRSPLFQDSVFQKISLSCSIPLLREWMPVLLQRNMSSVSTESFLTIDSSPFHYWDVESSERVIAFRARFNQYRLREAIQNAFHAREISFGNDINSGKISTMRSLTQYLETFGDDLVEKAHNRFNPLYIPGISKPNERAEFFFKNSQYYGNLNFFDSQKDVTSSIALSLDRNKRTIVVGECGVGKTAIALGSIYTHAKKKNPVTLIMTPGHMVEKWSTEIKRLYPFAKTRIISDINDVLYWENAIVKDNLMAPLFLIVGKDTCKMEYEQRPYLTWNSKHHTYIDPTAPGKNNKIIRRGHGNYQHYEWYRQNNHTIDEEAVTYFLKKTSKNQLVPTIDYSGDHSRSFRDSSYTKDVVSIWCAANPNSQSEWVKVPGTGWVSQNIARDYIKQCDDIVKTGTELTKEQLKSYAVAKSALSDNVSYGIRRCNISDYIKRRIPLDYFIADEVHLYSSKDTAQGKAFGNFIHAAKYTIALTGTLLNGYAQNIFSMLFRMYPSTFIQNGFKYDSVADFAKRYGVIETVSEFHNDYRHGHLPFKRSEKYKPGVSPLLFSKFLLDKAVFVTLADITSDLPNYEEIPVGVEMDVFTKEGYTDFYKRAQELINADRKHREKYIFKIVQRMNQYPDQPYDQIPIFNNDTGEAVICPNNISKKKDFVSGKDRETLKLVQQHLANNEKVLIYVNWVNASDCVDRLLDLFKKNNIKAAFLTASISARQREKWIQDKTKSGIDVMICNPSLVETGLDLLDFTTIIFYQLGYNLFTMRQASRRSLRLNQSKDVTVYFLYFKDTIQESIVSLMANKLQAAMAIEGKFSEEGLNAMSENDTLLTQLANNLTKNIDVKLEEGAFDFHTIKAQTSGNRFKEKAETMMKNWYFPVIPPKKSKETVNIPELLKLLA